MPPCPSSSGWQQAAPQSWPQSLRRGVFSPMMARARSTVSLSMFFPHIRFPLFLQ